MIQDRLLILLLNLLLTISKYQVSSKLLYNQLNLNYDHCKYPQTFSMDSGSCKCPEPLVKVQDECVCEKCLSNSADFTYNEHEFDLNENSTRFNDIIDVLNENSTETEQKLSFRISTDDFTKLNTFGTSSESPKNKRSEKAPPEDGEEDQETHLMSQGAQANSRNLNNFIHVPVFSKKYPLSSYMHRNSYETKRDKNERKRLNFFQNIPVNSEIVFGPLKTKYSYKAVKSRKPNINDLNAYNILGKNWKSKYRPDSRDKQMPKPMGYVKYFEKTPKLPFVVQERPEEQVVKDQNIPPMIRPEEQVVEGQNIPPIIRPEEQVVEDQNIPPIIWPEEQMVEGQNIPSLIPMEESFVPIDPGEPITTGESPDPSQFDSYGPKAFSDSVIGGKVHGDINVGHEQAKGRIRVDKGTGALSFGIGGGSAGGSAITGPGDAFTSVKDESSASLGHVFVGKKSKIAKSSTIVTMGEADVISTNARGKKGSASSASIATQKISSASSAAYGPATAVGAATPGKGGVDSGASFDSHGLKVLSKVKGTGGPVSETAAVGNPDDDINNLESSSGEDDLDRTINIYDVDEDQFLKMSLQQIQYLDSLRESSSDEDDLLGGLELRSGHFRSQY